MPEFPQEDLDFYTVSKIKIAVGYIRVVIGERGPYIEFDDSQIIKNSLIMPPDQRWRIKNNNCYYIELRSFDDNYIKIYYQKKVAGYADYKVGLYYISPFDLITEKYPILIKKFTNNKQI